MSSAIDFILIFVSLELVTISFYVLVAYMRRNASSLEAGVKYLILSALSTGFTIYGITWIYGITRQTNLVQIEQVLHGIAAENQPGVLFGALLVLVGLGFKIAAAPFQRFSVRLAVRRRQGTERPPGIRPRPSDP
jgi:NADH-quinone oxidoreductase subunit N